ncbi:TIGR03862 family flavoprotein [Craterilacuibacter sp.]|uniref:TIGR03862 family flavoprotein n=1 Tax=Craterilacuibacter sp. TaxID=2870909 RepID=UPI003F3DE63C
MPHSPSRPRVAIIGGGPAGLMAAEQIAGAGLAVDVYDAMPSVGRKFLLAGVGGMNITHSEPWPDFVARYGKRANVLKPWLDAFDAAALRAWVHGLGVETFVGSSGKVFPREMKAAPLLRAWLARLRASGVNFHPRHRWQGWNEDGELVFASPEGEVHIRADAVVLAMGGGSWQKLGSDGAWVAPLQGKGVAVAPLQPSNCGFDADWSPFFADKFAGEALKSIAITLTDSEGQTTTRRGGLVLTQSGVEGSLIYALSANLRELIARDGDATFYLDLVPDRSAARVQEEVCHPRGSRSLSSHLQSRVGLKGAKTALLRECLPKDVFNDTTALAAAIKAVPVRVHAARPLDEAISSAGGVIFDGLDARLMLAKLPGVFCAGEMLDWEAPTGGYLLTACFATGRAAGQGVVAWLGGGGIGNRE